MSMDPVYKLVEAVLLHGCMACPQTGPDGWMLDWKKPHPIADVASATIHLDHKTGSFEGSVRFQIGEKRVPGRRPSIPSGWPAGWTLPYDEWPERKYRKIERQIRWEIRQKAAPKKRVKRRTKG